MAAGNGRAKPLRKPQRLPASAKLKNISTQTTY
ncbi:hypothetical protein CCACVL1_04169 [Corchorus capsularis]|uniref:Uncharacterized protein n=1 Tax=Corchorus capsularis TaxID=210143 RepID=A0A1R3JUX1_COCAP|nr:hypothetical protein CCACVL1_04169 [Corchorus capsularis]